MLKSFSSKKPSKDEREKQALLALVELHLKTGKPVGSQTLKEAGFDSLSPATLRNYFAKLEEAGFLKQQHSSGGRIPTSLAYKTYAESVYNEAKVEGKEYNRLVELFAKETKEVHSYLQSSAETISDITQGAVFLSMPRFDQDLLLDVRFMGIDAHRVLCVVLTDFGTVRTELLRTDKKLSSFSIKRIEQFFHWKMTGLDKPKLSSEEEKIASYFYHEVMLRHIVHYSSFSCSEIFKTGFSKMLQYPDFHDPASLASGLSLFENDVALRDILSRASGAGQLQFWIGEDLNVFTAHAHACAIIAVPYFIQGAAVGSIAVLCPARTPYKALFATMRAISDILSSSLTHSLAKFSITYRQPSIEQLSSYRYSLPLTSQKKDFFLEDQTTKES